MNNDAFDEILKKTLSDGRLSRAERQALGAVMAEAELDDDDRARLKQRVFEAARGALHDPRDAQVLEWAEDFTKVLAGNRAAQPKGGELAEAWFSPGESCRQRILSLLRRAVRRADVCVFTITDNEIANQILATHQRGVKVRIITDDDKSTDRGSDIQNLDYKGVPVVFDQTSAHMHHKYAIFDSHTLLTGSYNWTRSAATQNEENILVTDDQRFVAPYQAHFDALWARLRR